MKHVLQNAHLMSFFQLKLIRLLLMEHMPYFTRFCYQICLPKTVYYMIQQKVTLVVIWLEHNFNLFGPAILTDNRHNILLLQ